MVGQPPSTPPARAGTVAPSRLQLPPGPWTTVLDCLCAHFPRVSPLQWSDRFDRGRVLDARGHALARDTPYRVGLELQYFREVAEEAEVPFDEALVHVDDHLVVADKPHFLPVTPGGRFVSQTLLARLIRRLGNPDLVPLHRIDRATAGLVLFSADPGSRARYQALFPERRIRKDYEAVAAPLPQRTFPFVHHSRLVRGEPFFRMREGAGSPNASTRIEVLERSDRAWRYALSPLTGRTHQLRVHMAALGAPIRNDTLYPALTDEAPDDPARPLQLLARSLSFQDPVTGRQRRFCSRRALDPLDR